MVMIDGIHFRDRVLLLVIGIDSRGNKHVLGLLIPPLRGRQHLARTLDVLGAYCRLIAGLRAA